MSAQRRSLPDGNRKLFVPGEDQPRRLILGIGDGHPLQLVVADVSTTLVVHRGIKKTDLATAAALSRNHLNQILLGSRTPSLAAIDAIARALDARPVFGLAIKEE